MGEIFAKKREVALGSKVLDIIPGKSSKSTGKRSDNWRKNPFGSFVVSGRISVGKLGCGRGNKNENKRQLPG